MPDPGSPRPQGSILDRAARVRLAVFDVDGVLTDGRLLLGDGGVEYKAFHSRDGHGIKLLMEGGIEVAVITGRDSPVVAERMRALGVEHVHQGQQDKVPAFEALVHRLGIGAGEAAYVGDDVVDLPVMRRVGFAVAVADAHPLVREHAHWVTASAGGRGAAREVCDLILDAQGRLEALHRRYLGAAEEAPEP